MSQTLKKYPEKKIKMYQELQQLPKEYSVVALSKMTKVRATQLMTIRKKFRNEIVIKIIKNKVALRAFEQIKDTPGIEHLSKELEGQCALMFTNFNPFKLNLIFDKNKVYLPAKGGDIASKEITIPAGNTGITPGPVLSEFKESNVPTKIDQGTIAVTKDTVVAKPGSVISQKLASLMSKLNIKPIEAGIAVNYAISEGLQYLENDLRLDLKEYENQLRSALNEARTLATESAYTTPETIEPILIKAERGAMNVVFESGYITSETAKESLQFVHTKALNVAGKIKGYTPQ